MGRRAALPTAGLLFALLALAPAAAEPLVIYGPGDPSAARAAEALQRSRQLLGWTAGEAVHVGVVLRTSGPRGGPALHAEPALSGGERCSGKPTDRATVAAELARAIEYVDALDEATARTHLELAWRGLVCLQEPADADTVWGVHFFRGVAAFRAGDEVSAEAHFADASRADPDATWDEAYGPDARLVYLRAREQVLIGGTATVEVHDPAGELGEVSIDGRPLDPAAGPVQVSAGRHLLQVAPAEGAPRTQVVELGAGQRVGPVARAAIETAILAGADADGLPALAAADVLRQAVSGREDARVVVIPDQPADVAHRFTDGAFVAPQAPTGARRWAGRVGPRLGLAVGGGVLAQGADARASRGVLGALELGIAVRLVGGLGVDLAATLGIAPFADEAPGRDDDVNLLLLARLGVRYTFGKARVRPFAGARAALRPNATRPLAAGPELLGGVELLPHGPLRIQVAAAGGFTGAEIAPHVSVTAGAGLAF